MTLQAACSNCTVWNTETSSGSPRPACIYYNKPGHFSIAMTPLFFLFFQGVIKCDFLSVPLLKQDVSSSPSTPSNPTGSGLILYESSHDVVVFSLLLSYFPCSSQRLRCCHKAHSLLRVHGLLLIITPDSSHLKQDVSSSPSTPSNPHNSHRMTPLVRKKAKTRLLYCSS